MAHVLVKELRDAVLQAAITGKLTEHLECDADVIELLKNCKKDKETAIKDGKFRKEPFRSPVVNDEFPDIPEYWAWSYISDISLFQEGPGILASDFCSNGIPLIRISGLQTEEVKLTGCNYLDPEKVERKWKHYKLDKGDIVLSTSASMDKVCEVYDEAIGAIPYTGQIRFKMYGGILKDYFKIFVKSPFYTKQISEQEAGGMIKHYGPTHLRKMVISIPPIEEQSRIVARVDELMSEIDEYEKIENQLVELKKNFPGDMKAAVLQAAMQGRLTEQLKSDSDVISKHKKNIVNDDNIIIPNNWAVLKLKDVATHQNGKAFKPTDWSQKGMKIIRIQNLTDSDAPANYCDPSIVEEKFVISNGDVLVSWSCTIDAYRYLGETAALNQHIFKVIFDKADVDSQFYIYAIKSLLTIIDSQRHGSTMTHITKTDYENLSFPLPPIEEQKRIVEKLDKILPLCEELEKEFA